MHPSSRPIPWLRLASGCVAARRLRLKAQRRTEKRLAAEAKVRAKAKKIEDAKKAAAKAEKDRVAWKTLPPVKPA